jgi:hypothetical protein
MILTAAAALKCWANRIMQHHEKQAEKEQDSYFHCKGFRNLFQYFVRFFKSKPELSYTLDSPGFKYSP